MNDSQFPIQIRVLFFAKTRELAGCDNANFQLANRNLTTTNLRDILCEAFNLELIKQNIIIAINENYCDDPQQVLNIRENDEIALIPPISGG